MKLLLMVAMILSAGVAAAAAQPGSVPGPAPTSPSDPVAPGPAPAPPADPVAPGSAAPVTPPSDPVAPGSTAPGVAVVVATPPAPVSAAHARAGAPAPTQLPGFTAIENLDGSSRGGVGLSVLSTDADFGESLTLLRLSAHGRHVDRASGLGGYARIPLTVALAENDSATALGNLEIGALFVPRLSSPSFGVIIHAGVTLPTGDREIDSLLGFAASFTKLPELYNALPRSATAKLGVSPAFRSGQVFGRIDIGLDWNLYLDGGGDVDKAIYFGAGLGVEIDSIAVMIESANLSLVGEGGLGDGDVGERTVNLLALSARATSGTIAPYASLVLPVDDDLTDLIDFAVTVGLDFKL